MREITLCDYLKNHTQQETADAIGCTQGAISQMIQAERDIRLYLNAEGIATSHYEIKKPKRRAAG